MESSAAENALPADPAGRVEAILNEIADFMDLDADVVVEESDEEISARFDGDDLGLVIGRRGQTIDAMQLICYRAAFRTRPIASGSRSTPPAIARSAARSSSARPSARRSARSRAARRSSSRR